MSKRSERLFAALGEIDRQRVDEAVPVGEKTARKKQWGRRRWLGAVAAVLAVAILGSVLLRPGGGLTAYAIAQAEYPKMARYPSGLAQFSDAAREAWMEDMKAQKRDLGDTSALEAFFTRSAQTFLTQEPGENRVYSPLNVYMALSMLAQLTDGDSRGQILALLGSGSMEELRKQAGDVWNSSYRDDGAVTSILASSLWLDQGVKFNQGTMDTLARDFYASSYRGEMGSSSFNKALQSWLSQQTGGLLGEQAGNIELDRDTIFALATTVYFKAKWAAEFSKGKTTPQVFHAPAGDMETDFMHQRGNGTY